MAVSNNYKKALNEQYNDHNTDWTYTRYRSAFNRQPEYDKTYAQQLEDAYSNLSKRKEFNIADDEVYKQYAAQANALSGLAIAGNAQQAQGLTGGYGSTYAPYVAMQGVERAYADNQNAKAGFAQASQDIYQSETNRLYNQMGLASARVDEALDDYKKRLNAAQAMRESSYKRYDDDRSLYYNQFVNDRNYYASQAQQDTASQQWAKEYSLNEKEKQRAYDSYEAAQRREYNAYELAQSRNYTLEKYDTYNNIASQKCKNYAEANNTQGMKAYLNGLVKEGKITSEMSDNLYTQYADYYNDYVGENSLSSSQSNTTFKGDTITEGYTSNLPRNMTASGKLKILSSMDQARKNNAMSQAEYDYLVQYYNLSELL